MDETEQRIEHDGLGEVSLPAGSLHGVHTARALANFELAGRPVRPGLVQAYGAVKLACAQCNHALGHLGTEAFSALARACEEMQRGELDAHVTVDALQGGAGTSTNLCVSEVLCNRALQLLGAAPGDYARLHPLEHVNLHQSTNDTYPTALRVAAIQGLRALEVDVIALIDALQDKEREFADVVKVARTQLQDAVLTTLGRSFGAFAEAFARDRWRVRKCEERLRIVPLGGTAIGTGIGAPREYVFRVVDELRAVTHLPLARAENPLDAIQNLDPIVEASGMLRALASNLLKVAGDLRLLGSGPDAGLGELRLPARQAGSSIMPGKINPVIPEAVQQAALVMLSNDALVAQAAGLGNLELNHLLPLIADAFLGSIELGQRACRTLTRSCILGLEADRARCRAQVDGASATLTALLPVLGYERATALADSAAQSGRSIRELVLADGLLSEAEFERLVAPEAVTRLGSPAPRPSEDPPR